MQAITELSKFKSSLLRDYEDVKAGNLTIKAAETACKLANAIMKVDNGIVQRLKIRERTKKC